MSIAALLACVLTAPLQHSHHSCRTSNTIFLRTLLITSWTLQAFQPAVDRFIAYNAQSGRAAVGEVVKGVGRASAVWVESATFQGLSDSAFQYVLNNATLACLGDTALAARALAAGQDGGVRQKFGGSKAGAPVAAWLAPLLIVLGALCCAIDSSFNTHAADAEALHSTLSTCAA
jgi:hypothetical protein